MSLDALLARLDADARLEREAVLARAADEADAIRTAAEREMEGRRGEALAGIRRREEREARGELRRARDEARRLVFEARRSVLDRVRAAVAERVAAAAADPVYRSSLRAEVRAALHRLPAGELTVRAAPSLAADVRAAVEDGGSGAAPEVGGSGRPGFGRSGAAATAISVVEDPDTDPGFLIGADGGRVVVDATLPARLKAAWPRQAMRVLEEIGGAAAPLPSGRGS